ncbi:MAG TPA: fused MFS/spermidine synthase [Thermoanaerobaculia bacterium]|nr:fused MFS/spermidine synthase [Thermoanaerobaculia bacterium]
MRRTLTAALLFCSGASALIYQTVWMRQFRLIFGASTLATAAVLSIFMGGLGIGSAILGKRADRHPRPLRLYGMLEMSIAATAALSQPLLWLVAKIYFGVGGSVTLGLFLATVLRLILATLVLAAPTLLMGGTLPAASRATGRESIGLLYGANTLGAVTGTVFSTFWMLEHLGNRETLLVAVVLNAIVGVVAWMVGRAASGEQPAANSDFRLAARRSPLPVFVAAFIVGFAFLLMELVWYRMLAPLLGGTTFTFGLILAVALLGIGFGGIAFRGRATIGGFALTCSIEAAAIAIPFALGDRLAILMNQMRALDASGFAGDVFAWTILTVIVVLPAAFVSGIQFPLLISLLGRGSEDVGKDVGMTYAWNTAGAIAGALAGGFGLLPLLSAPGAWRAVIVLLALLGVAAAAFGRRAAPAAVALAAFAGIFALGPTAVWRHSGIGAGRAENPTTINATREWINGTRRTLVWDVDGRESSVALADSSDYAFIVNGKADGSARGDAGTQVMGGLVGAMLHPNPQNALVIGLGTGSTAGWLGAVPSIHRVDVVELEPAVLGVARACAAVNHDVLHNPKVHIRIGDAREVLLAARGGYDIIFSEPSNPYRAGVASLFTEEFYRAATNRMNANGVFLQWLQTYDVDSRTIRTIYATICAVFPNVETWQTDVGDLLLVGTQRPIVYDFDALRTRVRQEPFASAIRDAWRVESLEGFLSHFVARDSLGRTIAGQAFGKSTDDRTLVEFGFARGLGSEGSRFDMNELTGIARMRREDRPAPAHGVFNWQAWAANRASLSYVDELVSPPSEDDRARHRVAVAFDNGELAQVAAEWRAHPFPAANSNELLAIAESLADSGSEAAAAYAEQLRAWEPIDADAVLARLRYRERRLDEATALLERVFAACRNDPWAAVDTIGRSLDLAVTIANTHAYAARLFHALDVPFAAGQWEDARKYDRALISRQMEGCGPHTIAALRELEPWPPWRKDILGMRFNCYGDTTLSDLKARAASDIESYINAEPLPLLGPRSPSGSSSDPQ